MSEWSATQLRELIRVEICAERRLRDALRADDRRWIEDALRDRNKWIEDTLREKDKALELKASSFPTTADFNALQTKVDADLSVSAGKAKGMVMFVSIVSGASVIFNAWVAYLSYMKP